MMRKLFVHPLIIVPLLVMGLGVGWHSYKAAARDLSIPQHNLLPYATFDHFTDKGVPDGWSLEKNGRLTLTTSSAPGYINKDLFKLEVQNYQNGDLLLLTPKVALAPHTTYLYKSFYLASASFDLLVKYFYNDGTSQLQFVRGYPHFDDPWSTASAAFKTGDSVKAVQIGYRVAGNGDLQLDAPGLEQTDQVALPETPVATSPNLIHNAALTQMTDDGQLANWNMYNAGNNQATGTYSSDGNQPYLHLETSHFKDGEAKWEHDSIPIDALKRYSFAIDYRATTAPELVAEYLLPGGGHQFDVFDTLSPAHDWTHYGTTFEAPKGATAVTVSLIIHQNGSVDSRQYQLNDVTKAGGITYQRPLVSITFDDGWESAYTTGASMLEPYGFRGTFYINPGSINNDTSFMKWAQVADLLRRGHQIASHGYDHVDMTSLSQGELTRQLQSAASTLTKRLSLRGLDFATPYGKDDPEVQYTLRRYYQSHRGTETGINTRQNFNPYNLKVMFIRTDTPLSLIQSELDEAKAGNGWFILTYHRIENGDNRSEMITSPAVFKQHLDLIKASGLKVVTVHDALSELQKQNR